MIGKPVADHDRQQNDRQAAGKPEACPLPALKSGPRDHFHPSAQ